MAEFRPVLVCLDGVERGRTFAVPAGETLLGRDPSCGFSIADRALSRRHCRLMNAAGAVTLADLESHNGTFVNDIPVHERALEHGDAVRVGANSFTYLAREGAHQGELRSGLSQTGTWIRMPESAPSRSSRELTALLDLSQALHHHQTLGPLAEAALAAVMKPLGATAALLVLYRDGLDSEPWVSGEAEFDETAVKAVIREQTAVFGEGLMAVPVPTVPAALWLAGPKFDEGHARMAAAVTAIAGPAIQAALRFEELEAENRRMQRELGLDHDMVGESARMQEVYRVLARVAPTPATVLITGESGTGKELVARAIHRNSPRARHAFVAINCAALTETLLESELFGHERGAFTGALAQKKGKIELADGGTLFLDEMGEMPLPLQAKLLRVLQQREFERVGGTKTLQVDLRIVAATNRQLEEEVKAGRFRQDLYYRLNVVTIAMPALRDRREDIPLLASFFVSRFSRQLGRRVEGLSAEARGALLRYDWPGNVRELENAMERAVLLGSGNQILPEDCPEAVGEAAPAGETGDFQQAVVALKRRLIVEALDRSGGKITEAARALGLHPNYLHRLMRNLELRA